MKRVKNDRKLRGFRKSLRTNSTSAEAFLWKYLKNKQLDGRKFRRQFSVGPYIIDFYCTSEMLGIELDGAHHGTEEGLHRDEARTVYLERNGIRVIRFENKDVFIDADFVLDHIRNHFRTY
jgi:very-short-patch-repair endonuclease